MLVIFKELGYKRMAMQSIYIGAPHIEIDGKSVPTTGNVKISGIFSKVTPLIHEIAFTSFEAIAYRTFKTVDITFPPGANQTYKKWRFSTAVAWNELVFPQADGGPNVYKYNLEVYDYKITKLLEKF